MGSPEHPGAAVESARESGERLSWRVGRSVPLNVYEGDRPICQCHTAVDARRIVRSVNSKDGRTPKCSQCEWLREKLGVADGKIAALVAVVEESHAERDQLREQLAVAKAALEHYVEHFGDPLKVARPALENIRR